MLPEFRVLTAKFGGLMVSQLNRRQKSMVGLQRLRLGRIIVWPRASISRIVPHREKPDLLERLLHIWGWCIPGLIKDDIVFEAFLPAVVGVGVWKPSALGLGVASEMELDWLRQTIEVAPNVEVSLKVAVLDGDCAEGWGIAVAVEEPVEIKWKIGGEL